MKTCPCCGYTYSLLNYHLKTRELPEVADSNYKSLHCLVCNQKIKKEASIQWIYSKTIAIFLCSILFSWTIRNVFNLWKDIDIFLVNIPFIVLFYLLIYILDFYFGSLRCYDKQVYIEIKSNENEVDNIHGIFGKKEKELAIKGKNIIFWLLLIAMIFLLLLFALT